ncbi:heterokaryon incompatibility protein [Colletotrichum higginsianum]|uniref:Heterokaryon incompatibility protein n=1 Tax=Colletotrichum higginsianum (strain IMI 349063) TaxID=759273 RepID=H1VUN1_COLHI|nr:heterokaryon incompatibility protein [Colletotrichum higginsianum]
MCGVYVCLSYTWGLQNTCVTTPDSLQSNLANIPYDQLPQTYKDAVTVALALNFPFLWIDSLCVIQGDEDSVDWKEQSSQMADIYGNAELLGWSTLAEPKAEGTLSRSWCFQEECLDEGYRCECAFSAAVSSLGLVTIKELYEPRLELGGPYETPNWMWQSTVEHYTRRRLTALSSVARVAQLALRTRYVTGHWWDADFLCSLCWAPVCTEETERTFSADCYVAPSWSWAAHNGPVTMWILVVPATRDDDVGAVSSGRITVRRVFLGVAVDTKPREQPLGVMMRKREAITFSFDRPLGLTSAADKYFCWVACVLPGQASRRRKSDTYCLIVLRGKPEGLEHVCERVGFVDHEAVTNSTCMRFFEGYRKLYRIAVIV